MGKGHSKILLNILPHSGNWIQVHYHVNLTKTKKKCISISLRSLIMLIMNISMANRNIINLLSTWMRNTKKFLLYGSLSIAGGDSLIK